MELQFNYVAFCSSFSDGGVATVQDARIANNGLFEIGNLLHLVALQASNGHWWLLACCYGALEQ